MPGRPASGAVLPALPSPCPAARSHLTHACAGAHAGERLCECVSGSFPSGSSLLLMSLSVVSDAWRPRALRRRGSPSFTPILLGPPFLRAERRVASAPGPGPLSRGSRPVGTWVVAGVFLSLTESPSHQPLQVGPGLGRLLAPPLPRGIKASQNRPGSGQRGRGACGVCPRRPGRADLAADSRLLVLGRGWVAR